MAWFHITHVGKLLAGTIHPVLQIAAQIRAVGGHSITLFFVLSGFVIPLSMQRSSSVSGVRAALIGFPIFLVPRLVRLQPPFVAACLLAIGLNQLSASLPGFRGEYQVTPLQVTASLLSDSLFLTGLVGGSWILIVTWTLHSRFSFMELLGFLSPQRDRPGCANPGPRCCWVSSASL